MTSLNNRKTIRKYQDKEVSSDLLNYLLSVSECTQTMGNLQLYSVVSTTSAENKARLAPAHFIAKEIQDITISFRSSMQCPTPCSIAKPFAIWQRLKA